MRVFKIGMVVAALGLSGLPVLTGCSHGDAGGEREQVGTLALSLTGTSSLGSRYRLTSGTFNVTGTQAVTLSGDTDPEAASIRSELPAGAYTIKLQNGWSLEKEVNGVFTPVRAVMSSPNPTGFQIFNQETTSVVFLFKAGDDVVELGNGRLDLSIAVDDGQCFFPRQACSGVCVDIFNDANNCGFCGNACAATDFCGSGFCQSLCPPGTSACNGACVDIFNDANNCGGCGLSCAPGDSCQGGTCQMACPPGTSACNGACVDIFSDANNCGGCGLSCAPGDACTMGFCQNPCGAGAQFCDGACVDTTNDPNHCGACGNACPPGLACSSGLCQADGPVFQFSGVANDLPVSALTGWTECFSDFYGENSAALSDILASCNQDRLLLGCRIAGSDTLLVAANAPRQDTLFDCATEQNCTSVSNGVGWYFSGSWSWGFARAGQPVQRSSCDIESNDPNGRLCWHTSADTLSSGWRCGDATSLNGSFEFERVVFTAP
jgi:hypothetical protein